MKGELVSGTPRNSIEGRIEMMTNRNKIRLENRMHQ